MPSDPSGASEEPRIPAEVTYTLRDLDQIKVLADALRVRVLEGFCQERTTKQVAEMLGEKPTKLYHHVDALEKVGLIELTRTRQNRGTLEKYYLAVAQSFHVDSSVFSATDDDENEAKSTVESMIDTIFENTRNDLLQLARASESDELEEEGVLSYVEVRAHEAVANEVRRRLQEIITELPEIEAQVLGKLSAEAQAGPERSFRLTLAYYPLDRVPTRSGSGDGSTGTGAGTGGNGGGGREGDDGEEPTHD